MNFKLHEITCDIDNHYYYYCSHNSVSLISRHMVLWCDKQRWAVWIKTFCIDIVLQKQNIFKGVIFVIQPVTLVNRKSLVTVWSSKVYVKCKINTAHFHSSKMSNTCI